MQRFLTVIFVISLTIILFRPSAGQEQVSEAYLDLQPRQLIDAPTAWTLPRGAFDLVLRVYPPGGILGQVSIGLSSRFQLGISYGAEGIISEQKAHGNPRLEFNVKLRLLDEKYYLPAIAVGYNSQGYGAYDDAEERFAYKSKGLFGVLTRSLYFYGLTLGGHAGINYSIQDKGDDDEEPTLFFGLDTRFHDDVAMVAEYDLALNDDKGSSHYGRGRGYLNLGIKWVFSENLELEAILKNLLNNRKGVNSFGREIRITYVEFIT